MIEKEVEIKRIGQQLAELRNERGYSNRALAELCEVNFRSISQIENGKYNVSIGILSQICDALDAEIQIIPRSKKSEL